MTDDQPDAPAPDDFPVVASGEYVLRLEQRIAVLERELLQAHEALLEALQLDPQAPGADEVAGRLDRHRRDIDDLKLRFNELIEYLERTRPPEAAQGSPL